MPAPFRVEDTSRPGVFLGSWDRDGNITIPGTLQCKTLVQTEAAEAAEATTYHGVVDLCEDSVIEIPCPDVTEESIIVLAHQYAQGTPGLAVVTDRIPGQCFMIQGKKRDTSRVSWTVWNPGG